ncbi:MAG: TetR/AcrR family transcriptional regulator [Nannocystaceae bacterium]|nr:TetR/AcrR family transcriptional regulator [Nannocystaceae bacterium]
MDSILEAATRIFEHGTATTNGIAKLAGVSIGSLYEYFPNKDAILGRLFEAHVAEAVDALSVTLGRTPPEETPLADGLRPMVEALLKLHTERPGLHRMFLERLAALPAVRARVAEAQRRLRAVVQAWMALHPEVAVPDVELATRIVVEGSDALVHGYLADDEGVAQEAFVDEVTRLWTGFLRGAS